MEPEYAGFCRGCNCFSEHLKLRPVINHNTGSMEVSMFCDSCRERFGVFPYDKREMPDAKLKEGEKLKDGEPEKNCLTCRNSFSDEEDHLHCMADGHNHEEIVADGHTCKHWC